MRQAIIETATGKVVNVVELPQDWTGAEGQWQVPVDHSAIDAGNGSPGDTWDGGQFVKLAGVKPTVIPFTAFKARFTATEFDGATDFLYESSLITGKPKRPKAIQDFMAAVALNKFDLLAPSMAAWMDALVAAGVLTQERRDAILTP